MIFSHVLYQLSYLGTGGALGAPPGRSVFTRDGQPESSPGPRLRLPLLHQGTDDAGLLLLDLQETVAGSFAPDRHVFEDARVVPDHLQVVSRLELPHLLRGEQDGQRTEESGHVEAVCRQEDPPCCDEAARRFACTIGRK